MEVQAVVVQASYYFAAVVDVDVDVGVVVVANVEVCAAASFDIDLIDDPDQGKV